MSQQDKKAYLRLFRKFQKSREVYYKPKAQRVLQQQCAQYLKTQHIDFRPMFLFLENLYKDVASVWGHKVHLSIKRQTVKSRQPIGFNERLVEILKQTYGIDLLQNAMDISKTTKESIQKILDDAATTGASISDITKEIMSLDFTAARARAIARTEVVSAANIAGDIIATESGLKMNKEWLAVLDSRTRSDHQEVHGTIIDQAAKFDVGGSPMMFPGDKDGPADEVINCRCVCVYIPKRIGGELL